MDFNETQEQIGRWQEELEAEEQQLLGQASKLSAWDTALIKNGHSLYPLAATLEILEDDLLLLQREIQDVQAQHQELDELLEPLELMVSKLEVGDDNLSRSQDNGNEDTHRLTEQVDQDLTALSSDLKTMVEDMNAISEPGSSSMMDQVAGVLSTHLDSLQWVEEHTEMLKQRLAGFETDDDSNTSAEQSY